MYHLFNTRGLSTLCNIAVIEVDIFQREKKRVDQDCCVFKFIIFGGGGWGGGVGGGLLESL